MKTFALVLTVAFLVLALYGCSPSDSGKSKPETAPPPENSKEDLKNKDKGRIPKMPK